MTIPSVVRIETLALEFRPRSWAFALDRRAEIDAHFENLRRDRPSLWNGRVLLLYEHAIERDTLRGSYLETDFASFLAWRDWGFPDRSIRNCFALGALQGSDGHFLLGVMSGHTANAGKIYFPGGTPDPDDIAGGNVDLEGSVRREVAEETGLDMDALDIEPGWFAVLAGPRIGLMKIMRARESSEAMRRRVLDFLARESAPELSDMRIVRGPADLNLLMPDFVVAFLKAHWTRLAKGGGAG